VGLLRKYGKVGVPYSVRQGKRVPIYGLYDALPEQVIKAQKRYGVLRNYQKPSIVLDPIIIAKIVHLFKERPFTNRVDVLKVIVQIASVQKRMRDQYCDSICAELSQRGVKVWQ